MKIFYFICSLVFMNFFGQAQTNPTPQALPYSQNFAGFTGSAVAYPAGWQGWTITGSTATTYPTAVPSGDQVLASGTTSQNSAVSAFVGDVAGKIGFLCTSAAIKTFALSINTTGNSGVQVSYLAATQRQQVANRIGGMGLQYRVGNTATFTDVAASEYQNPGGTDNITGTGSINPLTITVTLPAACDNQPEIQLRWVYREVSGAGNRPGFSVTNITVGTGAAVPTLTAGTVPDFGNQVVLTNSTSQIFNLSGTNLTGAPGNITVTAPSTDFQVSNNNSTWGTSATIAYTAATLASTPVYVRFTPQTVGVKTGNVSIIGGGVTSAVNVAVSGTGIAAAVPSLSATALLPFGNLCVNNTAGPNSFTINGVNLTAGAIAIGPLAAYSFSTSASGTFTATLSLTQTGGTFGQLIYVKFTPPALQSYIGNIPVSGGGAALINVAASGAGVNLPPSPVTGLSSAVTTTTATIAGSISTTGCSAVTGYGIEYSITNGFTPGTGTKIASSNLSGSNFSSNLTGLLPSATYYYMAYASNTGGTGYGIQLGFTTASPVLSATALTAFGGICVNGNSGPNSFTITGINLTAANVSIGPLAGYSFSTSGTGNYTASLSIVQPGGNFTQQVFVKFTPVAAISYSGNILVSGGAANTIAVPVSGNGANTPPTVLTGGTSVIAANSAILIGTVSSAGCSAVTFYGIEYSGINGFGDGAGTKISASNLTGTDFSAAVSGLVQNTVYYYKAFAVNTGGIAYGPQQTFTTRTLPAGLIIYSAPISRGSNLHYSLDNVKPGHYAAQLYNSSGQLVFQKDMIIQVNFIDDTFAIPGKLTPGVYTLQLGTVDTRYKKSFLLK